MLIQENHKDNVSFERVQRTLYQLGGDNSLKDWRKRLVYKRLLRLTQDYMQSNSYEFNLCNRSYVGANGGVLELSFHVPSKFDELGFSADDIFSAAKFLRDFIYIIGRFNEVDLPGSIEFQAEQFHIQLDVVIPVDFVQNYNN